MGRADLHTHTTASDGSLSPAELLQRAQGKGLKILSITDHDTIKGYLNIKDDAANYGIELITGVELTALWETREIHLLAYGFDATDKDLLNVLHRQKQARVLRMASIIDLLQQKGVDIDIDEIKAEAGWGNIGRPHAAAVLIKKGYVGTFSEAFIRYLSSEKLSALKTEYISITEAVSVIHKAGGVLSLAHPGPLYSSEEIEKLLSVGLDGIECIHPSHNFNLQRTFTKLAKSKNLLVTGGSDFHGTRKSDYDPYFGIVTLGEEHVVSIKRMASLKKNLI